MSNKGWRKLIESKYKKKLNEASLPKGLSSRFEEIPSDTRDFDLRDGERAWVAYVKTSEGLEIDILVIESNLNWKVESSMAGFYRYGGSKREAIEIANKLIQAEGQFEEPSEVDRRMMKESKDMNENDELQVYECPHCNEHFSAPLVESETKAECPYCEEVSILESVKDLNEEIDKEFWRDLYITIPEKYGYMAEWVGGYPVLTGAGRGKEYVEMVDVKWNKSQDKFELDVFRSWDQHGDASDLKKAIQNAEDMVDEIERTYNMRDIANRVPIMMESIKMDLDESNTSSLLMKYSNRRIKAGDSSPVPPDEIASDYRELVSMFGDDKGVANEFLMVIRDLGWQDAYDFLVDFGGCAEPDNIENIKRDLIKRSYWKGSENINYHTMC